MTEFETTMKELDTVDQQIWMSHRTPLEMYAFLLHWFVSAAERVKAQSEEDAPVTVAPTKGRKGRGGKTNAGRAAAARRDVQWTWVDQIPSTLALISKILRLKTHRIWTTTADRDAFIKCVDLFCDNSDN